MSDRLAPVLNGIRMRVEALALVVDDVTLPVLEMQAVSRRQTLDPRSMITVAKSATPEQTTRRRFGLWQTAYKIDVVLHAPYTAPDDVLRSRLYSSMRDTIVDALKKPPLAGAPDVFELDC